MNNTKDKRQMILDIAARIFSRYGYSKTSLDEIAQEARIAKGTIYYYFTSKEELFSQIVQKQGRLFVEELRENLQEMSGFESKLGYFLQAPMTYVCEKMPHWVDGLKTIPFNLQKHFDTFKDENRKQMLAILMEIIKEGIEEGLISEQIDLDKLSVVITDWFLVSDLSIEIVDFDNFLMRIKRDHDTILKIIMYGILKRG